MTLTKRSLLTTGAAVTLAAAVLLGGGTFAYLSDNTNDTPVINEFDPNTVYVELSETTGNTYDILPGTSAAKDPTVTVTTTVDAFVFVEVTDNTDGLVTYEIADSWQPLNGYENVYYQKLTYTAPAEGKVMNATIPVLLNNTVSYDKALENSDMLNEDGTLKDGFTLSFKASAVQAEPWYVPNEDGTELTAEELGTMALAAYLRADAVVSDAAALKTAVTNGGTIVLSNDIAVENSTTSVRSADVEIDLNGHTLSSENTKTMFNVLNGYTLHLSNGTIDAPKVGGNSSSCPISVNKSQVILDDVDINCKGFAVRTLLAGASAVINGGTITASGNGYSTGSPAIYLGGSENSLTVNGTAISAATLSGGAIKLDNADLTVNITDAVISSTTAATAEGESTAAVYLTKNTKNSVVNLTNTQLDSVEGGIISFATDTTINVTGTTIQSNRFGIYQNGSYAPVNIVVKDSVISDTAACGIYLSNTASAEKHTLTVENSSITGPTAVEIKHTDAVITGSTLTATAAEQIYTANGNGACTTGYPLAITSNGETEAASGTVTLSGNTYVTAVAGGESICNQLDGATVNA